jgi:hypothetical protein
MGPLLARLRRGPTWIVFALGVVFCACGARTGLGVLQGEISGPRDAAEEDATVGDGSAMEGGGGWCAMNTGPVASCDAGPDVGPIQRCREVGGYPTSCEYYFPPVWGCCIINPPNGLNQCFEPAAAPAADRCGDY